LRQYSNFVQGTKVAMSGVYLRYNMYFILRTVNSTLLKRISLAEYSYNSMRVAKIYLEYNISGTEAGGTQI
jgi:hypothetical protein